VHRKPSQQDRPQRTAAAGNQSQACRRPLSAYCRALIAPGIRHPGDLFPDHKLSSRMTYAKRNTNLDDSGSWRFAGDGETLLLQGAHGAPEKFALPDCDTLRKLDGRSRDRVKTELRP